MLVDGIKSRPVYTTLAARRGRLHLILTDDGGTPAVLGMIGAASDEFLARAVLIHAPSADGRDEGGALGRSLAGAGTGTVLLAGDEDEAVAALRQRARRRAHGHAGLRGGHGEPHRTGRRDRAGGRPRARCHHGRAPRFPRASGPVRPLQGDHRSRHDAAGPVRRVRARAARSGPLLAKDRRVPGRVIDAEEPGTAPDPTALFA